MNESTRRDIAVSLREAEVKSEPIDPPSVTHPELDLDDAYGIQLMQIVDRQTAGARIRGHKVGLTSLAMQRQLGVDQPDFGHLMDDMFHPEGLPIGVDHLISPKIEPEIAFVLDRDLRGPGVSVADAISAVAFVLPALEIIDSRIMDWRITLVDTVADNASSAGVVLGSRPTRLDAVDLRLVGCVVSRSGKVEATGAGGAVLGSPLNALVWLANTVGERGVTLQAGHVIMPGAVTAAIGVEPNETVTATFGGLGSVTARFTQENS